MYRDPAGVEMYSRANLLLGVKFRPDGEPENWDQFENAMIYAARMLMCDEGWDGHGHA